VGIFTAPERDSVMSIAIALWFLFEHDLRANAFRVCRDGKPVPTFPDHALIFPDTNLFNEARVQ
jgi:hypothetical protein